MPQAKMGVIGGSGLYNIEGLSNISEVAVKTPFGEPSDRITVGRLGDTAVAFLPRHGRGHHLSPGEIPYRANIYALKSLGVEHIVSVTAVGSLQAELKPGHLVIPYQLIDRTKHRASSFFSEGIVAHIIFAEPFCPELRQALYQAATEVEATTHQGGTYVVMEGPAFSTRAESHLYRSWGASIIGMTALPEANLAREAEICYATIAGVTDYDCWQESCAPISIDVIIETQRQITEKIRGIIRRLAGRLPARQSCGCGHALETAIVTSPEAIPEATRARLEIIAGKYLSGGKD